MTNKMIDNRVKKLRALEAQKAELEAQIVPRPPRTNQGGIENESA